MFDNDTDIPSQEEDFDFGKFLRIMLENWFFILICLVLSMSIAYAYVWYKHPVYKVSATVMVDDNSNDVSSAILEEVGVVNKKRNIENEIAVLTSRSQMSKAMESLNLNVFYRVNDGYRWRELYKESPVRLAFVPSEQCGPAVSFDLHINSEEAVTWTFELPGDEDETTTNAMFGETISNAFGSFTLTKADNFSSIVSPSGNIKTPSYTLVYRSTDNLTSLYLSSLEVEPARERASILRLTLTDLVPERGVDILDAVLQAFIQGNIEKKNQLAANSLKFIDSQLETNLAEMSSIEKQIQDQKLKTGLTSFDTEAEYFLSQVGELDQKISEIDIQLSFLQYLQEYVSSGKNLDGNAPSSLGINDPLLQLLITRLSELRSKRANELRLTKADNPIITTLDSKIRETETSLLENVKSIRSGLEASKKEVNVQLKKLESKVGAIPKAQYELLALQRKYAMTENLYLLLLEKKSENAIMLASTVSDNSILDEPRNTGKPVSPKESQILLLGFLIGIGLPVGLLFVYSMANSVINDKQDLKSAARIPFWGLFRIIREWRKSW